MCAMLALSASLPTTAEGWLLLTSLVIAVIVALSGALRLYIHYRVEAEVELCVKEEVEVAVASAIAPLSAKLDTFIDATNLQTQTMAGEMKRIGDLEIQTNKLIAKVENGITHRQIRIEEVVTDIQSHLMWDGKTERRSGT